MDNIVLLVFRFQVLVLLYGGLRIELIKQLRDLESRYLSIPIHLLFISIYVILLAQNILEIFSGVT